MIEIGQIYGNERTVEITFGDRSNGTVSTFIDVPKEMDSINQIRQHAIEEAHRRFKAILDGELLPMDEEIEKMKAERSS